MADAVQDNELATELPRRRRRRWPWILLALGIALVVLLRAALPSAVERGAAYASRHWLGLPARIDNADFDLFGGAVVLEGVTLGASPDDVTAMDAAMTPPAIEAAGALLRFDRISARLSWQELYDGAIRLTELSLETPSVRLQRESDGAIDPLRHAQPQALPEQVEEELEEEASEPWPLSIDRFVLSAPNVEIIDPPSGEKLLEFSLESFGLDRISAAGSQFALGGVDVQGPVLRVRRDLVFAPAKAAVDPVSKEEATPAVVVSATPPAADLAVAPAQSANADSAAPVAPPATPAAPAATPAASPATPAAAPPAPAAAPAPGYRIEKIDIARATFTWVSDKGPLDVALALKASDITADEGKSFPIDLRLEIDKGRVALTGDVGILPPSYKGKLVWSGLPFPRLLLASLPDLAAWLRSADSSGDVTIDLDVAGSRQPPTLAMNGRASVETLAIADPGDKEIAVGWKQLDVEMKQVTVPLPEPGKPPRTTVASFERIVLTEPKIHYTHPAPSLNAMLGIASPPAPAGQGAAAAPVPDAAAKKAGAQPAKAAGESTPAQATVAVAPADTAAPAPVDVTIATLELTAGDLQLVDTTVTPPVTSTAKELFVSARDVHFPDPSASGIKLRAILPKDSALTVEGDLRPGNNGDFVLSLQQLELQIFSPYAELAASASLDAGHASLKTRLKLRGKSMSLDNDLVLRKLGVSLRDPSTFDRSFGVPIDLALALLRDPSGDIKLRIPVEIDEKGAQVSMGAIVASALRAALIGAITSPLKLLGSAFSGGKEGEALGIAPVASVPGSAEAGADAPQRVDGLAKLLAGRPAMGLELKGRVSSADRPLVAEQILIERFKAGDGLPKVEGDGFLARRRIGQAVKASAPSPPDRGKLSEEDRQLYERYITAIEVPPARLDSLAQDRAGKLRGLLQSKGVEAARVTVGPREADGDAGVVLALRSR